ncbi:hypothetical protein MRX96_036873 [Rhipicephalus microplus]
MKSSRYELFLSLSSLGGKKPDGRPDNRDGGRGTRKEGRSGNGKQVACLRPRLAERTLQADVRRWPCPSHQSLPFLKDGEKTKPPLLDPSTFGNPGLVWQVDEVVEGGREGGSPVACIAGAAADI